jgi:hypothetical protein
MPAEAKAPLLNADIELDGIDLSNSSNKVSVEGTRDEHDVTGFQGGGWKENQVGLKDAVITIEVFQDYSGGGVHQTCKPLFDSGDDFLVKIKPDADPVAADNPLWEMTGRLSTYNPIGAEVGSPQSMTLTIKNASKDGLKELTS